jgi:CheY-like chemotaxis protein
MDADMKKTRVLFLDDNMSRHFMFSEAAPNHVVIHHAHSAKQAIELLDDNLEFDQVFLDHDLGGEQDEMSEPGKSNSGTPTGMDVVDHIIAMAKPPQHVVVHSMNAPAAEQMLYKLQGPGTIDRVSLVPFHQLMVSMRLGS